MLTIKALQQNQSTKLEAQGQKPKLLSQDIYLIIQNPYSKFLVTIDVSYNNIGNGGFINLLQLPSLTSLNVSWNKIKSIEPQDLPPNTSLTRLYLQGNAFGNDGVKHLLARFRLIKLDLTANGITSIRSASLTHQNSSLQSLDISFNKISQNTFIRILKSLPSITELNVAHCGLNDTGLLHILGCTKLKKLSIACNRLGDIGSGILAQTTSIKWLDISSNNLNGAIALGKNYFIDTLMIENNPIRDAGTTTLKNNTSLTSLNISSLLLSTERENELKQVILNNLRNNFILTVVILMRNIGKTESVAGQLSIIVILRIISFMDFSLINKTREQGLACAEFIAEHINEINGRIKDKQGIKIKEILLPGMERSHFQFFSDFNHVSNKRAPARVHFSNQQSEHGNKELGGKRPNFKL